MSLFVVTKNKPTSGVGCRSLPFNLDFQKFRLNKSVWLTTKPEKKRNGGSEKKPKKKQLRKLGVDESTIETLRTHDWAIFNSDRRYYQRMQEAGTYLEGVADDTQQPEIKTVEDFEQYRKSAALSDFDYCGTS